MRGGTRCVQLGRVTSAMVRKAVELVEDAVGAAIQQNDPQNMLNAGDFQDVLEEVSGKVVAVMDEDGRTEPDGDDLGFISRRYVKLHH